MNTLDPSLRRGPWSESEDRQLLTLFQRYGRDFVRIAPHLRRSSLGVRNRIHSTERMVERHRTCTRSSVTSFRKEGELFVKKCVFSGKKANILGDKNSK